MSKKVNGLPMPAVNKTPAVASMPWQTTGQNIRYALDNGILYFAIDTRKEFGVSNSGKTITVATTRGNKEFGDIIVGVNAYKYPEK